MMLGSLVYNLVGLPEVEWLKIYYQDAAENMWIHRL